MGESVGDAGSPDLPIKARTLRLKNNIFLHLVGLIIRFIGNLLRWLILNASNVPHEYYSGDRA